MKERLYEDFLPEGLSLDPRSPAEMVNEVLRESSDGGILDLLPALRKGLERDDVFPRTASVWSDRGAFMAYRELMKEARKRVISLDEALPEDRLNLVRRERFRGDLAEKPKFLYSEGELVAETGEASWEEEIEVASPSDPRSLRMPALGSSRGDARKGAASI